MFLRLRNLIRKDEDLNYKLTKGYDRDQEHRKNDIHSTDIAAQIFGAAARNDLTFLSKAIQAYDQSIKRKMKKLNPKRNKSQTKDEKKETKNT